MQKQTFSSQHKSDYFNILFRLSLHCNPNKHIQVYDEERSYQTNGSKVTSSSWWPSESLFSRAAWWGEHSSDVIHWNRNSKYFPFLNNVILPWQHIITGFLLFISQVRKEGEQFITHESLILIQILTEIQFPVNTYFEYYIHIHMQ